MATRFDLDDYMTDHMPSVGEKFKPFGIEGRRVLEAVGTPFGGRPAYSIIANLEFDAADQFRAAVAAESGPVFGDVPNFSNKSSVVVIGDLVGAAPRASRLKVFRQAGGTAPQAFRLAHRRLAQSTPDPGARRGLGDGVDAAYMTLIRATYFGTGPRTGQPTCSTDCGPKP